MAKKRKRCNRCIIVWIVLAVISGYLAYRVRTAPRTAADYSRGILSYAAQPHFIASDFLEQLTGAPVKLELYDLDENLAYCSVPREHVAETIGKIAWNPAAVEYARENRGRHELGEYVLHKTGVAFIRMRDTNFRVDPRARLECKFRQATYALTVDELLDWIGDRRTYGGAEAFRTGGTRFTVELVANHGALVAVRGEPGLTQLVAQLTAGSTGPEERAQRLLDFVTSEIAYDGREASWDHETLKRASEVLMSRKSDCSGLAILYASLLEQTDVDYRLLYLPSHIAAGVVGKFPNDNGLAFRIRGQVWHFAETTAKGFQIGRSILERDLAPDDVEYLQRPAPDADILDAETGRPLVPERS